MSYLKLIMSQFGINMFFGNFSEKLILLLLCLSGLNLMEGKLNKEQWQVPSKTL